MPAAQPRKGPPARLVTISLRLAQAGLSETAMSPAALYGFEIFAPNISGSTRPITPIRI